MKPMTDNLYHAPIKIGASDVTECPTPYVSSKKSNSAGVSTRGIETLYSLPNSNAFSPSKDEVIKDDSPLGRVRKRQAERAAEVYSLMTDIPQVPRQRKREKSLTFSALKAALNRRNITNLMIVMTVLVGAFDVRYLPVLAAGVAIICVWFVVHFVADFFEFGLEFNSSDVRNKDLKAKLGADPYEKLTSNSRRKQ
ncbi:hypothetical protein O2N63_03925 [Aliiroseovarius sp. KMU-50]|uniref:Uncharacterized protein n=1 Tax=Aliiroseovarius salicola TaxID=3009082 RepID=A0ABT4W068_9RHOB|nr:hypothetical protein [Aliiroseovarius sp. KMU-50]MDA5093227.1 hypothetical protein [Aliiroseovarius sp. KMU-50]